MKLRSRLRAIFIIIILVWAYPSMESLIIGSIPIIIGQIIHFISAGYLIKQEKLITSGPYRFVRNPFYVGSFLVDAGLCLTTQNIYVTAIYLPLFYLVVINWRIRKEERALKTLFGSRYDEYCQAVPRIIPRFWPAQLAEKFGRFDWQLILKYREQWRLFRILGLLIYFYLRIIMPIGTWGFKDSLQELTKPPNNWLVALLVLILCFPPMYEFALKPLWKKAIK